MNDALLMRIGDGIGHLTQNVVGAGSNQAVFVLFQQLIQGLPGQQLHGHKGNGTIPIKIVGTHNIGMRQALRFFGFLLQAHQGVLVTAERLINHFDRHPGIGITGFHLTQIPGLEHRPHTAGTQQFDQLEALLQHHTHAGGTDAGCTPGLRRFGVQPRVAQYDGFTHRYHGSGFLHHRLINRFSHGA